MLLKIKVKRVKNNPNKKVEYLSAELVGTVKSVFKFKNLCDYQYLPIVKNEVSNVTENIYHDIVPQNIISSPRWFREKSNVPFFLPPVVFNRRDVPMQASLIRNETKISNTSDDSVNFAVTSRTSRLLNSTMISFDINLKNPIPTKPKENVASTSNLINEADYKMIVSLFEKRPIWTLISLKAHIKELPKSQKRISTILASIAYFYQTGPWRNCFVKFGYDPRVNFESRYYQILDYRVRNAAVFKTDVKLKRPSALNKLIRATPKPENIESPNLTDEQIEENFKKRQSEAIFTSESIPSFRARHYQLIDIHLPKVQEMLQNIPNPMNGATCNEKRGWLPVDWMEKIRDIVNNVSQANMVKFSREKKFSLEDISNVSLEDSMKMDIDETSNLSDGDDDAEDVEAEEEESFDEED